MNLSKQATQALVVQERRRTEDLFADAAYRSDLGQVLARRAVASTTVPSPGVIVISHGQALLS